jgi:hypothetical protein
MARLAIRRRVAEHPPRPPLPRLGAGNVDVGDAALVEHDRVGLVVELRQPLGEIVGIAEERRALRPAARVTALAAPLYCGSVADP